MCNCLEELANSIREIRESYCVMSPTKCSTVVGSLPTNSRVCFLFGHAAATAPSGSGNEATTTAAGADSTGTSGDRLKNVLLFPVG